MALFDKWSGSSEEDKRSDEELVAAFQGGDGNAFAFIYSRYRRSILNWLTSVSNIESREDLVQERFLKPCGYLYSKSEIGILMNMSKEAVRKRISRGLVQFNEEYKRLLREQDKKGRDEQ